MGSIQHYNDCARIWYETRKRKLDNNTYLIFEEKEDKIDQYFGIKLHNTIVVKYYFGGDKIELNTGGWYTVTTKDRINKFSPTRVFSDKSIWYIYKWNKQYEFHDGILVNSLGTPINEPEYINKNKLQKKLDKMVKEYIKGYIQSMMDSKSFPIPTNGDCWGCLMRPEGEQKYNIRDQPMGFSHFIDHFKEKYYVPSIAIQAISRRGNPSFIYQLEKSNIEKGIWPKFLEEDMKYMFKTIKVNLMNLIKEN